MAAVATDLDKAFELTLCLMHQYAKKLPPDLDDSLIMPMFLDRFDMRQRSANVEVNDPAARNDNASFLNSRPRKDSNTPDAGSPEQQSSWLVLKCLTQGNDFFETRFIRALTEQGGDRVLQLPHLKTQVFKAYLQWAHFRRVVVMDPATARESSSKTVEQIRLSNLFDLAHRITDVALQNAVIAAFLETPRNATPPVAAATIEHLRGDQDDDYLREILVQWFMTKPDAARYLKTCRTTARPNRIVATPASSIRILMRYHRAELRSSEDSSHRRVYAVPLGVFRTFRIQRSREGLQAALLSGGTGSEIEALGVFS